MSYLLVVLIFIVYYIEKYGFGKLLRYSIFFVLKYIFSYRAEIIKQNLQTIFHSSLIENHRDKYYIHLADLIVETLWCYRASPEELKSKLSFKNPEVFDQIYQSGENATILLSHIGNWELFCQWAGLFITDLNVVILYTPIKNKGMNDFMLNLRQRFGSYLVSTKSALDLFRIQKTKKVCINLFAIDQNPGDPYHQHWLDFFGVQIPVISGAEKFAKSQSQRVYFLYVTKSTNYELELIELPYDTTKTYDLTEKQFHILEKNILENPSLWLLSHNRFKYRKEYQCRLVKKY